MRQRIDRVMPLVREHLAKAQQAQQRHYNRAAQPREFQTGDRVMVLVPTAACKFLATWKGPYMVVEKIGPVTYRVHQPYFFLPCHVSLQSLKVIYYNSLSLHSPPWNQYWWMLTPTCPLYRRLSCNT